MTLPTSTGAVTSPPAALIRPISQCDLPRPVAQRAPPMAACPFAPTTGSSSFPLHSRRLAAPCFTHRPPPITVDLSSSSGTWSRRVDLSIPRFAASPFHRLTASFPPRLRALPCRGFRGRRTARSWLEMGACETRPIRKMPHRQGVPHACMTMTCVDATTSLPRTASIPPRLRPLVDPASPMAPNGGNGLVGNVRMCPRPNEK